MQSGLRDHNRVLGKLQRYILSALGSKQKSGTSPVNIVADAAWVVNAEAATPGMVTKGVEPGRRIYSFSSAGAYGA